MRIRLNQQIRSYNDYPNFRVCELTIVHATPIHLSLHSLEGRLKPTPADSLLVASTGPVVLLNSFRGDSLCFPVHVLSFLQDDKMIQFQQERETVHSFIEGTY